MVANLFVAGLCVDGAAAWTGSAAAGASPADLAIAMGNHSTHELVYDQLCSTVAAATKGEHSLSQHSATLIISRWFCRSSACRVCYHLLVVSVGANKMESV